MAEAIILGSSLIASISTILGGIAWLNRKQNKKFGIMIDLKTAPISEELKKHIMRETRKDIMNYHENFLRRIKRNRQIPFHLLNEAYETVLYAREQGINGTTEPMQEDIVKWYSETIRN